MPNGYWGKILRVDLTNKKASEENISEEYCRKYLGGVGFAADILYKEVGPKVGALDPENRLIFGIGPFQASNLSGSGKFIVVAKSPLTNAIMYSMAGGDMAMMLKKSGYDALVVQGKSDKPVYLWINDGKVEIKDAHSIWGKNTAEMTDLIREELGEPKASVAGIGPSGEKLIAFSCIVVDKHSFAGRGGLGAVMGSKNLKAIVAKGTRKSDLADPKKVRDLTVEIGRRIVKNIPDFIKSGTTGEPAEERGDLPVKYWKGDSGGVWSAYDENLRDPNYTKALNVDLKENSKIACANCVVHCHRHIDTKEPAKFAVTGSGPEYEALGMLGGANLVGDIHAVAKANEICSLYGLDVISAGAFVAFATECYEKGLLTKEDTFGMELKWGDGDQLVEVVKQIANKEKLGALAADGIVKAAQKIGGEAPSMAVHVKGLDFPAHDPRAQFSLAVSYATSSRGACHTHGICYQNEYGAIIPEMGVKEALPRFEMKGKDYVAAKFHDLSALDDALTICNFMMFGGVSVTDKLTMLNAITNWNMSMEEFLKISERLSTLKRAVNVKWGFSRKDDKLPEVVFMPSKKGIRAGKAPVRSEVESAIDGYYKLRGWDSDGKPTPETMKRLGLS
jgi:aldehyde:ferredoxin oxidoreductase